MNRQTIYQLQDHIIMPLLNTSKTSKPEYGMILWWNSYYMHIEHESLEFQGAILLMVRYYWQICHCEGIKSTSKGQKILGATDAEWKRLKPQIFDDDKFFKLSNGEWHFEQVRQEWIKAAKRCENASKRSRAGNAAKAAKKKFEQE